jgi:putative transposase
VLSDDTDHAAFFEALGQTKERYPFPLLLQAEAGQTSRRILPSLTVSHTGRLPQRPAKRGPRLARAFPQPAIQDDAHVLRVLRYVDANPLRAGMVADLAHSRWSSYPVPGLGRAGDFNWPVPRARER